VTESELARQDESQPDELPEYVVVLRARSFAHFLPEEGCQFNVGLARRDAGRVRVRTFTSWVGGANPVPRELIVEVRGRAPSLDEAVTEFANVGRPIAMMAGFVANVRVGLLEVHLAYDSTAGHDQRDFLETFLPDEHGAVGEGRVIRQHLMSRTCSAFLGLLIDGDRVDRALRQYELALREWYVGGEWLALSHLYIAVETLTPAVIRKIMADRAISEEELAQSLGVVTDGPELPDWRRELGVRIRREVIFAGDTSTYRAAKEASDGLEHGFLELDKVVRNALKSADKTFFYVRRTIVDLLQLPAAIADELMTIKPKDVQSRRKVVRGRLLGVADDPAPEDRFYPVLEWRSQIGSVVREGSSFTMSGNDLLTVRTHPDVSFQLTRIELRGRLEDGQAPVEVSAQDVDVRIEPKREPTSADLLTSVMPLIDAAVASGANANHTLPRLFAFNLFGQGVAFFQSAHTLINAHQAVEALPSLRGLTMIAARFEQLTEVGGPGAGVVLRLVLDSVEDDGKKEAVRSGAASAGITVPDELPGPETTTIWHNLTGEMDLAHAISEVRYSAVGLHLKQADAEHWGFHTKLEPGPFTDLVASACVIAQLRLLQHAAEFFGWTMEEEKVNQLFTRAEKVNAAAAKQEERL
jgi:hypothetical protein